MEESVRQRNIRLFTLVLAFLAVAGGLGASIFSNYYSEVYHIDAIQRGFLEIPRESPGILCMLLVALLAPLGNLWMSVVAQALVLIGLVVMGLFSPSYGVMLAFLFLHSMGMHLFMPLNDAISMDLAERGKVGAMMGRFKSVNTVVTMLAACAVFVGFRAGIFSFATPVILPFVIAALAAGAAILLLIVMARGMGGHKGRTHPFRLLFRRQYTPYYLVTLAYGCQKRIKIVFAPWVIIQLLGKGADTVALLSIATYFVGSWFAPLLGRMMDKLGTRKMLWLESGYILVSFTLMGVLAGMLSAGALATDGWQCWLVYAAYVLCILFEQFNMVHSFMMRAIALDPEEVTETLSVGLSVDHIMAISVSPIMGIIWARLRVLCVLPGRFVLRVAAGGGTFGGAEKSIEICPTVKYFAPR